MHKHSLKYHVVKGLVTYDFTLHLRVRAYMTLEVSWDGLWTLSIRLSQSQSHGSWLVALSFGGSGLQQHRWKELVSSEIQGWEGYVVTFR